MILVVGGTGLLGTALVRRLLAAGLPVRVLTRDPARAAHLRASGVDVATGDLRDIQSLRAAVRGVTTIVAAAHGFGEDASVSPATVDRTGNFNLIDAAAAAHASVVLMSGVHASPTSPIELFRAKHAAEEHLMASGTPWAIVRATAFAETWAGIMGRSLLDTGRTLVFGRGVNPINFVSIVDVAAFVEHVVIDATLRGEIIEIGGSTHATFQRFAAMVGEALGRPSQARHIPRAALRAMSVLARPFKPSLARHAGAAVVMDTQDMTFDASATRRRFPDLPNTPIPVALSGFFAASGLRV